MKLFRLRFIVLGLLLCIFHVWCRTCDTDFTDPASSTYIAQIVLVGTVSQKLPPVGNKYNITINIERKGVLKGQDLLKKSRSRRNKRRSRSRSRRRSGPVTIGEFGPKDLELCLDQVERDSKYMFFLNKTSESEYYKLSALPLPENGIKKAKKLIKKLDCKKPPCVSGPTVNKKRAMKDKNYPVGKSIQLRCQAKKGSLPVQYSWLKDGKALSSKRGLSIKTSKKGSRLKIKKAKSSHAGVYTCVIKNLIGEVRQRATIGVLSSTQTPPDPVRRKPCGEDMKNFCLNNGTCQILESLNTAFCTCSPGYGGSRCEDWIPPFIDYGPVIEDIKRENDLQRDRNIVIVGVIAGILLFIGICVASYFLAQRRKERLRHRLELRGRRTIEDNNIPQVYRPLLNCDEVDAQSKANKTAPLGVPKVTQTTETCFEGASRQANMSLYVNPLEGFMRPECEERNSRSRLPAVSLEDRPKSEPIHSRPHFNSFAGRTSPVSKNYDPRRHHSEQVGSAMRDEGLDEVDGPSRQRDLSSQDTPPRLSSNPSNLTNGKGKPNSSGATPYLNNKYPDLPPPPYNFDSDSDDEIQTGEALPSLHISEDEGEEGYITSSLDRNKQSSGSCSSKDNNHFKPPYVNTAMIDTDTTHPSEDNFNTGSNSSEFSDSSSFSDDNSQPERIPYNDPLGVANYWNERGSIEFQTDKTKSSKTPKENSGMDKADNVSQKPSVFINPASQYQNNSHLGENGQHKRLQYINEDQPPIAL